MASPVAVPILRVSFLISPSFLLPHVPPHFLSSSVAIRFVGVDLSRSFDGSGVQRDHAWIESV